MKTTVNLSDFRDAFHRMGRNTQFSYEALEVLYDYLEECENDTGEEWELDVIAICCDFEESDAQAIIEAYSVDCEEGLDEEEVREVARTYLIDEGVLIGECDGNESFVYRQH
jgi:hypothetical protein